MIFSSFRYNVGAIVTIGIIFIILTMMKGCASIGSPDGYRYRETIYVGTADRAETYSGVRSVRFESDFALEGFQKNHQSRVSGEAIPIITRSGKTYFALQDDVSDSSAFNALAPVARSLNGETDDIYASIATLKGKYELPQTLTRGDLSNTPYNRGEAIKTWPVFVTFSDPGDPRSIRLVDPKEIGVSKIMIGLTSDKIEPRVEAMFSDVFWEKWKQLASSTYPERKSDQKGPGALYYTVPPDQMKPDN